MAGSVGEHGVCAHDGALQSAGRAGERGVDQRAGDGGGSVEFEEVVGADGRVAIVRVGI